MNEHVWRSSQHEQWKQTAASNLYPSIWRGAKQTGKWFLTHLNTFLRQGQLNYISRASVRVVLHAALHAVCAAAATNVVLEWHLAPVDSYGTQCWRYGFFLTSTRDF